MRPIQYSADRLKDVFVRQKVITMDQVMKTLGSRVRMTAYRKLQVLGYRTSYSHGGRYFTLDEIARYNEDGLWSFQGIRFSVHGSVAETIVQLVEVCQAGYFAMELKNILHTRVQDALGNLYRANRLDRCQIVSEYLYLSPHRGEDQIERRKRRIEHQAEQRGLGLLPGFNSAEAQFSFSLFFSSLNEKQQRLYAGLESMRIGRGGDAMVARLTGMNVKTVARGRKELLAHDITPERIRREGAGRSSKKNRSHQGTRSPDGR